MREMPFSSVKIVAEKEVFCVMNAVARVNGLPVQNAVDRELLPAGDVKDRACTRVPPAMTARARGSLSVDPAMGTGTSNRRVENTGF